MNNNTYIELGPVHKRGCYNFSFQLRKITSYLEGKYEIVNNFDNAQIVILLSCIATPKLMKRNYSYIDKYLELNKKVILYGCMSKILREDIVKKYGSKLILIDHENEDIFKDIYSDIDKVFSEGGAQVEGDSEIFNEFKVSNYHIVVGKGCKQNCSFCVIREGKKISSFSLENIYNSFLKKYDGGLRHFRITSDDLGTYGIENNLNLFEIMGKILSYDNEVTLEIGPIYPSFFLEKEKEFMEILETGRITQIFTAIQHNSTRILQLMNRTYDHNKFESFMINVKQKFPHIQLSTHLIYGYPTETKEEFINNLRNIKIFDSIQFYGFSQTYKMKKNPLPLLLGTTIGNRKKCIKKVFGNQKGIIFEEDVTKMVVIKSDFYSDKSTTEKYF